MNANTDSTIFPTTRFTLLARLNDPAARAWGEFFSVYGPVIYRMARYARLSEEAADEIVAVVMRNFVSSVAGGFAFDPDRGQFRQYLRTLTNRSIGQYRRREKERAAGRVNLPLESVADEIGEVPNSAWAQAEREERWQACLERMRSSSVVSPRDFDAFQALALRGEPAEKVARRFGVTVNRLYGIKHSVIRRLRQIREALDAEYGEV